MQIENIVLSRFILYNTMHQYYIDTGENRNLKRNSIFMIVALTGIWIILMESATLFTVGTGLAVSVVCVIFCRRFLPMEKLSGINYFRFFLYIFYLIGQMYVAAVSAVRLVIKGARTEIVEVETVIKNEFLRVMLANSITLVPGSVTLDINEDRLTVLLLTDRDADESTLENAGEQIKGGLERRFLKAQKDI